MERKGDLQRIETAEKKFVRSLKDVIEYTDREIKIIKHIIFNHKDEQYENSTKVHKKGYVITEFF